MQRFLTREPVEWSTGDVMTDVPAVKAGAYRSVVASCYASYNG